MVVIGGDAIDVRRRGFSGSLLRNSMICFNLSNYRSAIRSSEAHFDATDKDLIGHRRKCAQGVRTAVPRPLPLGGCVARRHVEWFQKVGAH